VTKMIERVEITGAMEPGFEQVLTTAAVAFVAGLVRKFRPRRDQLLAARALRVKAFEGGELPDFLPQTRDIRDGNWKIAAIPDDLLDRRVEITGPVDRKMVVNALNSGARVFMGDFEDASSPTWENMVDGQLNMIRRWQGSLDFTDPARGKTYALTAEPAVLMIRPRGWHLSEAHILVDGEPAVGGLVDFGFYVFHNARAAMAQGSGAYFYLPKLESHLEARLWNDVFVYAQEALNIPNGSFRATVLIETLPAAFEMDEILYELKDHIVGLNCGRWDYIFSFIKTLKNNPDYLLPDRAQVGMGDAFLDAYSRLLIKTCHRRGAFAMGGMAAAIPNRRDPAANAIAFDNVRADKIREVKNGHDGTWVAHPDMVPVAMEIFDAHMPGANQLDRLCEDVKIGQAELLEVHQGTKTEEGLRLNIRVGVQYLEAWLRGRGAVPLYNLMEDAATAEISRAQIWQWLKFGARLEDGQMVTKDLFQRCFDEEMERVRSEIGDEAYNGGRFPEAIEIFRQMATADDFETFLTLPAYERIK